MKHLQRILSLSMALLMLLTFAVPAYAYDDLASVTNLTDYGQTVDSSPPPQQEDAAGGDYGHGETLVEPEIQKEQTDIPLGASGLDPPSGLIPNGFTMPINVLGSDSRATAVLHIATDSFIQHRHPFGSGTQMYPAYIFTIGGQASYCIEPARFNQIDGTVVTGSQTFSGLSKQKQIQIARAMASNPSGAANHAQYMATQTIIWQIAAGEALGSGTIYNDVIAANSSQLKSAYDSIAAKMSGFDEAPSFMSGDKNSPTLHTMSESGGRWSIDLRNTNSKANLANFKFSSKAALDFKTSGNTLTVSSSAQPGTDSFTTGTSGDGGSGLIFWLSGRQAQAQQAGAIPSEGYMAFSADAAVPDEPAEPEEGDEPGIGYLTVYKYEGETNLPLGGAIFKIQCEGYVNEAFEVPYGGKTAVIPIPAGMDQVDVTVTEVSPPHGYVMDSTPKTVTVTRNETVNIAEVSFANFPQACSLTVYKHEKGNKSIPLEGARFRIRYADANVSAQVWTLTSDSSGSIKLDLPAAGTLIVEELEAPAGYVIGHTSTWDVVVAKGEHKQIDISNDRKAQLTVYKRDAQTGQLLSGAVIKATLLRSHTPPYEQGMVYTVTTGADGKAVFSNMIPGEYRIEEQSPPQFYLGTDVVHTVSVFDGSTESVTLTFENEPYTGLTIKKVDATDGRGLAGAVFKLYEGTAAETTKFLGDYQSNKNGMVIIQNLTSNKYYTIVEAQPPHGYFLDEEHSSQTILIKPDAIDKSLTVVFRNMPKPKLLITKIDEVTGKRLAGAVFRVAERGSKEFVDVETGPDGTVLLENLNQNWFQISEIRSPSGYVLESGVVHDIELIAGETAKLVVKNRKVPSVTIRKIDSVTNQPMQGVVFEISEKNGRNLGEFVTDLSGEIQLELAPALLVIREKRTLDGYLMDEQEKELLVEAGKSYVIPWQNTPKNPIIIKKLDSVTGKPIPDTMFTVTKVNGEFVGSYTTGHNGYATIAGLEPGWFLIKEERANPTYIASGETKLVQLKAREPAAVEFHNKPRTGLQIRKYDSVTGQPISGVQFTIEELSGKRLGTFTSDAQGFINLADQEEKWVVITEVKAKEGYKPDFVPRTMFLASGKLNIVEFPNQPYPHLVVQKTDENGQPMEGVRFKFMDQYSREIGVFTTNHAGQIHLTGMDEGRFYLQEISTKPGYEVDSSIKELFLQWGKTETIRVVNKPLASLRIIKIDAVSKQPIPGTTFLIYDSKNNMIGEYVSDDKGIVELPRTLAAQKLKIKEIKAAPGYVLDEQSRTIEVKSGETAEIVWTNQPMRGRIQIVKKAAADSSITGDKAGAVLSGAVFEVYDKDLNVVDTIIADSRGIGTSTDLPLGTYAVKEVTPPQHYFTDGKVFYAEVKLHGDLIRFEVLNTPVDISVTVEKRGNVEVMAGDNMRYDFSSIANTSNIELQEFYWHDQLPTDAVRLKTIHTGTWNDVNEHERQFMYSSTHPRSGSLTYSVTYKTNLKSGYKTLAANLTSKQGHTLDCSPAALGLAANEYITDIRFEFGTVNAGFREDQAPSFVVTTLPTLPDGYRIVNNTDVGGQSGGKAVTAKDTWVTIALGKPKGCLPKTGF